MNWFLYNVINFVLYSFLGWVLEKAYCYYTTKSLRKDGFLVGPFKPMYGVAMGILIYLYYNLGVKGPLFILLCLLITTIIEFLAGYLLKEIFNLKYWDYSNLNLNFKGIVSLRFSLYWVILSFFVVKYIQPIFQSIIISLQNITIILTIIILIYIFVDFIRTLSLNIS